MDFRPIRQTIKRVENKVPPGSRPSGSQKNVGIIDKEEEERFERNLARQNMN